MKLTTRLAALSAAAGLSTSSFAYIAFSNFGPGDAFNIGSGWTIAGPQSGVSHQVAVAQFIAQASGPVSRIRVGFGHIQGPDMGEITLYEDSGSDTVGQWHLKFWGPLPEFGSGEIWDSTNPFSYPILTAGQKYWIGCHFRDEASWDAWNLNSIGDTRLVGLSSDGGQTYSYANRESGVFEVNVVPEPAALAALGMGLAALLKRKIRR